MRTLKAHTLHAKPRMSSTPLFLGDPLFQQTFEQAPQAQQRRSKNLFNPRAMHRNTTPKDRQPSSNLQAKQKLISAFFELFLSLLGRHSFTNALFGPINKRAQAVFFVAPEIFKRRIRMTIENESSTRAEPRETVPEHSLLDRLTNWFLPPHIHSDLPYKKRFNLLVCMSSFSMMTLVMLPLAHWLLHDLRISTILLVCALCGLSTPILIRQTGSFRLATNALLACGAGTIFALSLVTGGIFSPALAWVPYIALVSLLLRNPKSSIAWLAICLATIAALFVSNRVGSPLANAVPTQHQSLLMLLSASFATIATFGLAYAYHALQDSLVMALAAAKTRAENANLALADANDALESKVLQRTAELTALNESLRQEVSDRRRAEDQIRHAALHDILTGLPNRNLFLNRLEQMLYRLGRRPNSSFAVLFINVDRFGVVNDSLGHTIGDQILVSIAQRLRKCVRPNDTIARLEGDEFAILLDETHIPEGSLRCAERLHETLVAPHHFEGYDIFTTISIGIALSSSSFLHPEDMIQAAKVAMLRAKSKGKGRYHVFDTMSLSSATPKLKLETELRRALHRGNELVLYYQPIFNLNTGKIAGFEALMRWDHPEHGLIPPLDFIPLAEETELILPMGRWAIHEAARQLALWQEHYYAEEGQPLTMSVNVSSRQFSSESLITEIRSVLDKMNITPNTLKLEVTESLLIDNPELAASTFEGLQRLGIHISIDDFGTGYSSLTYLYRYPFDILKIDRAFVSTMCKKPKSREIVKTIANLAHGLALDIVAEGIETRDELEQLRALNCQYGQGYFFARPLPPVEAEKLLAEQRVN